MGLTREQKRAAANRSERAFISAVPGSGKTTVAAERYGVIRYGTSPVSSRVVALSFARSARGELHTRIRQRWGSTALRWPHTACTLDALHFELLSRLLRDGHIRWPGNRKELTVLDSWRGQQGARLLSPQYGYWRVAHLKGRNVRTAGVRITQPVFAYGNKEPHEEKLAAGICTHEEIRSVMSDVLSDRALRVQIGEYLQAGTKGVIVDEVFDGNRLDLDLVRVAAEAGIPTTLIGDPWQALYEFRGAEPELVPGLMANLSFTEYPLRQSFRFQTDEMKVLADELRAGNPMQLDAGSAAETDVVLATKWWPLWQVSADVLPLSFGQIYNRTDAALALLLEPMGVDHFGPLAAAAPEAAFALNIAPESMRDDLPEALKGVWDRLSGGTEGDAIAALELLRSTLENIGGRRIPTLSTQQEAKRVQGLVALSRRLGRRHLVPGMTVHQAKGREWDWVGVHLEAGQRERLAAGLVKEREGDRQIYVALTRASRGVLGLYSG